MIGKKFEKEEYFIGEIVESGGLVKREKDINNLIGLKNLIG